MPRRPATSRSSAQQMSAHAADATRLLKALANQNRLMILCLLVEGESTVGDLNARLDLSQSALSQHLAVLRDDGLVQTRREAQSVVYSLPQGPARRIVKVLHRVYCGIPK